MLRDHSQNLAGLTLIAADRLADLWPHQVDYHDPTRPKNVDVSREMIAGVDNDPQAIDTQDCGHTAILA